MTKEQKTVLIRIAVSACLSVIGLLSGVSGIGRAAIFAAAYLISGADVLWSAVKNIVHGEFFDEEFLMSIATVGALSLGEYPEAAAVMIFYQTGELLSDIAVEKSKRSLTDLTDLRPDRATVLRGGEERQVAPEQIEKGEILLLRAGERIPVDGIIVEGATSVDTSALTGESLPAEKSVGDRLLSGCVNLTGTVKLQAEAVFEESTVAGILRLMEASGEKKAKTEDFITKFSRIYTPCVVGAAVLTAVTAPLLFHADWGEWIRRALVFLVVSCPCALVVSVPLTFFCAIGAASKNGILIKGSGFIESLSEARTVVFDKTGTLTRGVFAVEAIHSGEASEAQLLDIAAAAESRSTHPIAGSVTAAHAGHIDKNRVGQVTELAGLGLCAVIDSKTYYVGNRALMEQAGAESRDCHLPGTVLHISEENRYLGHIVVNDRVREEAAGAIAGLKKLGVKKTVMLTGDTQKVAGDVAGKAGIDEYRAGLLPADKVEQLERLLSGDGTTVFVGDGINDAPVLKRADIGIAMGALGSDAAIEAADVVLMYDDLTKVGSAIGTAKRTLRVAKQNIVFSLSVKATVMLLGVLGLTGMQLAVFADVGVTVLAVMNALRILYGKNHKYI